MRYSKTPRLPVLIATALFALWALPLAPTAVSQQVIDTLVATQTASGDTSQAAAADTSAVGGELVDSAQSVGRDLARGDFRRLAQRTGAFFARITSDFFPRMVGALIVLIILLIVFRIVERVLARAARRAKSVDAGLEHILVRTYRIVALTFIAVLVLAQFGVNVAALLAGLSIAGIAVGFAAQDTVQNYIAGITILLDKPFRVGDNVDVDGVFGRVVQITLRSTRVQTQNHEIMVMPNVQMINQKLVNHTVLNTLRIEIPFGIAYKEYPAEARRVVLATTEGDERLDPNHPPEVVVKQLNDSSVDMSLRVFLKNPQQELAVRWDYIERVREALREAGIEIPYPHLQLFVDEAKAFEDSYLMQRQRPQ